MQTTPSSPAQTNNRTRRRPRRWIPYVGGVALAALIAFGLWPQPLPVETGRVSFGAIRGTVNEEGKTRIKHRYVVSAPVAGYLRRIELKAGADVQSNAVVAVIDPVPPQLLDVRSRALAEARRDTAQANLDKVRTDREFSQRELKRFEKLFSEKTVSIQELETAQWREASAAKAETAAEAALRQAEAELAEFGSKAPAKAVASGPVEVKAPASGRVLRVTEESSRVVSAGSALLEIGDPADLEVVIEVLSRDGAVIERGARIELDQWGGRDPLVARVRLVEPAAFTKVSALGVEEQRVNVIADLVTSPKQRRTIGDNYRVEARIVMWEVERALKVPSSALFRHGTDWAAWVVVNGRAQRRVVKAGRTSGTDTEVLDGVKEGDNVILFPGDRVRENQRIRVIRI